MAFAQPHKEIDMQCILMAPGSGKSRIADLLNDIGVPAVDSARPFVGPGARLLADPTWRKICAEFEDRQARVRASLGHATFEDLQTLLLPNNLVIRHVLKTLAGLPIPPVALLPDFDQVPASSSLSAILVPAGLRHINIGLLESDDRIFAKLCELSDRCSDEIGLRLSQSTNEVAYASSNAAVVETVLQRVRRSRS